MKRFTIFSLTCFLSMGSVFAQQGVTQCGVPTGQPKFPLQAYQELPDPAAPSEKEWAAVTAPQVSWGTIDVRYAKHQLPALKKTTNTSLKGWRGERVNAQAVVWTGTELKDLNFSFTDFKDKKGNSLSGDALTAGFVRYVMTDELNKDGRGACGYRKSVDFDSLLVADPIDSELKTMALPARTVQPIWVQCWIPQSAVPGTYKGQLLVNDGSNLLQRLNLEITVSSRVLPQPSEWAFHLDLWQSPYAVARYYQVPLWSQEHLDAMRPLMKMLANAGQKIITATLTHKPWNGQTEDYFDTMVTWIKRADGTWTFDYTIFDRWVEFMMSVGIDKQINCYSMVPWKLSFLYFDQATNSMKELKSKPGEQAYHDLWLSMLKDFAAHLKSKGWFDITHIAMDERPMPDMLKALKIIREADPNFKVSLAGSLHKELSDELNDYCIAIAEKFSEEMKTKRKAEGKITTYYTCCAESHPNTYTFSNPAEGAWIAWYAAKENLDGYLRWALNSWTIEPLLDSRFYTWGAGDTYLLYPGGRTCLRFENLVAGIQAYEKIRILKTELQTQNKTATLRKLERVLESFDELQLLKTPANVVVEKANLFINGL